MTENNITPIKKDSTEKTQAFTFEVKMLVQILATDQENAEKQLDAQGGYVTRRDVKLVSTVELFNGIDEDK